MRRSAFPFAIRSARDKRVVLRLLSFVSSARLASCPKNLRAWACARSYSFAGQRRATTAAGYALSQFDLEAHFQITGPPKADRLRIASPHAEAPGFSERCLTCARWPKAGP